jgi:hypothetical protein
MALKSNEVLREEAIQARVEEVLQENLMWRGAYRPLDLSGINTNTYEIWTLGDEMGKPEAIAEGAVFPFDEEGYSTEQIEFQKYGFATPITMEAREDTNLNIVDDMLNRQARQMSEFLNDMAFEEMANNVNSNSPAGNQADTSKFEYEDVIDARETLRKDFYSPDVLVVNIQAEADLLTSDQFLRASDLGDRTVREGSIGRVAGMDVMVADDDALSSTDGEGYMVDTDEYAYEAIRDDIQTNQYEAPERQVEMMQIFTRRSYYVQEPDAAIKVEA